MANPRSEKSRSKVPAQATENNAAQNSCVRATSTPGKDNTVLELTNEHPTTAREEGLACSSSGPQADIQSLHNNAAINPMQQLIDQGCGLQDKSRGSFLCHNESSNKSPSLQARSIQPRLMDKNCDIEAILNRLDGWLDATGQELAKKQRATESKRERFGWSDQSDVESLEWSHETSSPQSIAEASSANQNSLAHEPSAVDLKDLSPPPEVQAGYSMSMIDRIEEVEKRIQAGWESCEIRLETRLSEVQQAMDRFLEALPGKMIELLELNVKPLWEQDKKPDSQAQAPTPITEQTSWETRKRHLLSEFGLSSDEIEQIIPESKKAVPTSVATAVGYGQAEDQALEALQSSIQTLDKIQAEFSSQEIEQLKEQLTAKLREAEIELSINRAKLSKEWAALEQKLAEVAQREAALKSKYCEVESSTNNGLLDRISRHLSRKS
jgi:hypothetical protein